MEHIAAAFIFFTRLPIWKLVDVPNEYYKRVVSYWPMTGWLTAGISSCILYAVALVLPLNIAVICAIASRILLTGAFHEDGLADFFDGFGGGTDRESTLSIMKDSHIGSYGVIALIIYFLLYFSLISALPIEIACLALLVADPCCKFIASQTINRLPYARTAEQSKTKEIYQSMGSGEFLLSLGFGIIPLLLLFQPVYWLAVILPLVLFWGLTTLMKRRIGGYTGDCCGAVFLMCELAFLLSINIIYHNYGIYLYQAYFR